MKKISFLLFLFCAGFSQAALVREGAISGTTTGFKASAYYSPASFFYFIDTGTIISGVTSSTQTTSSLGILPPAFNAVPLTIARSTFTGAASAVNNPVLSANSDILFVVGQSSPSIIHFNGMQMSSATYSSLLGHFTCGVLDPTTSFAYYGTDTNPPQIVKIDLSNLALVSSITLPSPNANLQSAVIDTQNHFAYFGSSTTPGNVVRINLTNFTEAATLTLTFNGSGAALSGFLDNTQGYLWFGTGDSPGQVVKIQLSNFQMSGAPLVLLAGENRLASAIYDATTQSAYFGTATSTGIVVQINPVGMKRIGSLMLNTGEAYLETAQMDSNQFGYFGTLTNPGKIVKVDLIGGAPEITGNPSSQDVAVGQTATFFVSASGRSPTYQWNRDSLPIAGATQTTYQLTNTALTDDGAAFSCTVSNSSGSVTSSAAILTVEPDIHVFPNPWRANRHAGLPVTFNEIPPGAAVEIFTLAAQWVRTVPENGGIATWDLKNNSGQNAASGYYFYYVKITDDRHTLRGKFAIIR